MRSPGQWLVAVALAASVAGAQGAPNQRRPYIGYLCAAGGQKGTTVRISAGGQNLRGCKRVIISGEGVSGTFIRHRRTPWLLRPEVRREVERLRETEIAKVRMEERARFRAELREAREEMRASVDRADVESSAVDSNRSR